MTPTLDRLFVIGIIYQISVAYIFLGLSSAKGIPPLYIFGDSMVDVGNNFYIKSLASPVFPNGIDFGNTFGTPSGRYTNGRTIFDILGQEAGLKSFTPPYFDPTTVGEVLLRGVNYASSAAGIFNETGSMFGNHIYFGKQINYFNKTRREIISNIGFQAAKDLLRGAIYAVSIGVNDVIIYDIVNLRNKVRQNSAAQDVYLNRVISKFRTQLTRLYNLDARKILVSNSGAIGCMPYLKDMHSFVDGCVSSSNQLAQLYNKKLRSLLEELTRNLVGSVFVHVDSYAISEDIFQNYISYGFEHVDEACCNNAGVHGGLIPCLTISKVCPDRSKDVFWDAFHPSERANLIAAKHMMDGGLNYMSPMNFRQLLNA